MHITVVTVSNADQVLLIILSIFLAMFLLLSIVALIWILQILAQLKKIIAKAEQIAKDTENNVTSFINKTGPALALFRLVSNIADSVQNSKKKSKEDL